MRRRLMIPCPQCEGGESEYFYKNKSAICSYCDGMTEVNIFDHHNTIGVTDERCANVREFVNDQRFVEYLESKSKETKSRRSSNL